MNPAEFAATQQRLADQAAVCDIQSESHGYVDADGRRWYDTRPMLDPREHADEVIDMARVAIDYALHRGLISRHPVLPHLVRMEQQE